MKIERLVVGQFQVNAYIVYADESNEAAVVDPGDDPQEIISLLVERGLHVTHIINTHGHGDHIGANAAIKAAFPDAKICIHGRDAHMLTDTAANLSMAFGYEAISPPADLILTGNTEITAAGITFRIEHLPGHSPGSVCLVPSTEPPIVFSGDTLFAGTVGRSDFPGGNMHLLLAGIREKIMTLPDETVVYPGHGVPTTVAVERTENVFVGDTPGGGETFEMP